uniref:Butyrophilin subfamily 1 member A1 n=1 Tax=Myotis lucifugus TaxID=59463 RepID=G1Q6G2_MYOLU
EDRAPAWAFPPEGVCISVFFPLPVSTEKFMVLGPAEPLVAVLGRKVVLSCHTTPARSAENMQLRWFRSKFSEAVLIYEDGGEQPQELMAQYAGRTSLVTELLGQGQAAVLIRDVQASDDGLYSCSFREGEFYEEASLELKVAETVAKETHVARTGCGVGGGRLHCSPGGWLLRQQRTFHETAGAQGPGDSAPGDGSSCWFSLFQVNCRPSSNGGGACTWLVNSHLSYFPTNPLSEKDSAAHLPRGFPQPLLGTLPVGRLPWGAGQVLWPRSHQVCSLSAWRKAQLYAVWGAVPGALEEKLSLCEFLEENLAFRMAVWFGTWESNLDTESGPFGPGQSPDLVLSVKLSREGGSMVARLEGDCEDSGGSEAFVTARCQQDLSLRGGGLLWGRNEWFLGVCREDVKRTGWYTESPEKGFWVVGQFEAGFCPCTKDPTPLPLRQLPRRVGVFLDYSEGDVSFYNMTDGSHIFSFPRASFSGTLFPYFRLKSGVGSLTICPMAGAPEGLPVP